MYALYDSYQIYDSVKIDKSIENIVSESDFEELLNNNKNIVGFINIDNTSIVYPIVKGKDNIEYLNKNYKGEYSFSGSLFLDYRNNNFKDNYSIIYGHSLINGGMLSDIKKYKDKEFFNNHLTGFLITKNYKYEINILSISSVLSSDEVIYNTKSNKKDVIDFILSKSINRVSKIDYKSKIIVLSTCKKASGKERLILMCTIK